MPPWFRFDIGAKVTIIAQQSTGVIWQRSRQPRFGQNVYVVKVDANQPLITIDGLYTATEGELSPNGD